MECHWNQGSCSHISQTEEELFDHVSEQHSRSGAHTCLWLVDETGTGKVCGIKTPNKNHFHNHLVGHFSASIRPLACNVSQSFFSGFNNNSFARPDSGTDRKPGVTARRSIPQFSQRGAKYIQRPQAPQRSKCRAHPKRP